MRLPDIPGSKIRHLSIFFEESYFFPVVPDMKLKLPPAEGRLWDIMYQKTVKDTESSGRPEEQSLDSEALETGPILRPAFSVKGGGAAPSMTYTTHLCADSQEMRAEPGRLAQHSL